MPGTIVDNPSPDETQDNSDQQNITVGDSSADNTFSWKGNLNSDLQGSPLLKKFEDTPEGLAKAFESHAGLEKLLGHDKIPVPKDENDTEAWAKFSKALGIPDKAEAYGLPDAEIPENLQGISFNKQQFAEIAHAHKLTPSQASSMWKVYTEKTMESYGKAIEEHKKNMVQVVNQLKGKWGDAYEANVDLGQTVINKFSGSPEAEEFLTATLVKDPRGIEFLARIGNQFAENKVGDFSYKRFSLSPDEAQNEIDTILRDPKHPYNNAEAPQAERQRAIDYVNSLYAVKIKPGKR